MNDNTEKSQIKMEIESGKGIYTIKRVEVKGKGKKGKILKFTYPDGKEKEGEEAKQEIAKFLHISFKDFTTTIYQHQEIIRDFVIQKPGERSDANGSSFRSV
ncbi:unnamed protein product [marine sediment metagenome]|uniref:Uncharacterized protein n=1 Tax=marine sediment metagenome TaxID=412755 RepID=X0ZPD6_9ZZZZ